MTDNQELESAPSGDSEGVDGELVGPELPSSSRKVSAHFEGPLPPASELQRYEEALPGLAERIVVMAEKEQSHRHSCDKEVIADQTSSNRSIIKNRRELTLRGQVIAGGLCLFFLLSGLLVVSWGHLIAGTTIAVTGAGAIVASFLNHSNGSKAISKTPEEPTEDKPE